MAPRHVVVMGVSGSGKSAVAVPVAEALGFTFAEGDAFHPPANVEKMRSGTPLTDEDRWPWLEALAAWTRARAMERVGTVMTCSALRRVYRDVLRTGAEDTFFVHLTGEPDAILARMAAREHFMPPSLLSSQFDTLEALEADERGVTVDNTPPLAEVVAEVLRVLRRPSV